MRRHRHLRLAILTSGIAHLTFISSIQANEGAKLDSYIPHSLEVPEFTPPPPAIEKAVPAMRVDSTVTILNPNGRMTTIIRGEASTLPDIPVPPDPLPQSRRILTDADHARIAEARRRDLMIGATVYDRRVSIVHWQHPDTGESFEAVCGFDIGLLAGIGSFVSGG